MWRGLAVGLPAILFLGNDPACAGPLEDMLVKVYLTNPRLEAARANLRAADDGVARARAGYLPTIASSGSAGYETGGSGSGNLFTGTVSITQNVYSGGETEASTSRAMNVVGAERARLVQAEQDVLLDAIAAYTALVRDKAVLDLASENERRMRAQLDATKDRKKFGDVTKTDVAQAESRLARATADRVRAEGDRRTAEAEYRRIVGEAPVAGDLPDIPGDLPADSATAEEQAAQSYAVEAAGFEAAAARDDVQVAMAATRPRLNLTGEFGYTDVPSSTLSQNQRVGVAAVLAIPLYQGGGEYARVRQSKQVARRQDYALEDARRAATAEATAAFEDLRTARERIKSLEKQTDASAFALEGVKQEALVGARTVLDVLDAEQELFAGEVELQRVRRDAVLAAYRLRAATGRLTATALGLQIEAYDPGIYHDASSNALFGLGGQLDAQEAAAAPPGTSE